MITGRDISFSYEQIPVLKDISFDISDGDFVAILGPNGAGKTTLIKLIVGLLPMQKGTLEILGKPAKDSAKEIGYVPQRYSIDKLFPGTVKEILDATKSVASDIISELGTQSLLDKKFTELSGGQQQRVLITLALQNNPKILILDEPTVGVDIQTETEFLQLLKHINKIHHVTVLLITHDVGMVPTVANKVLCINHNICCMGPASQSKELLKQVYGEYEEHHTHHGDSHV